VGHLCRHCGGFCSRYRDVASGDELSSKTN
jgi:hypothetical protein